jgi:hypothetical protein
MVLAVHGGHVGVQQAGAVQLAQDGHDAAGAVHVFDVVLVGVGRHLAQLGTILREMRSMSAMVKSISASCAIAPACAGWCWWSRPWRCPAHGVLEGLEAHGARQHGGVVLLVVALAQLDDPGGRRA